MSMVTLNADDALRYLDRLRGDLRTKIQRKALRASGKPVLHTMRDKVGVASGALKKSLNQKVKLDRDGQGATVIGPNKKVSTTRKGVTKRLAQNYKARWLEGGTKRMRARPFVQPAFDAHERKIPGIYAETIAKEIDRL